MKCAIYSRYTIIPEEIFIFKFSYMVTINATTSELVGLFLEVLEEKLKANYFL